MNEMLNHAILTKEEEIMYGQQVVDARSLRLLIEELVQEKRIHNAMLRRLENENKNENKDEEEKEEEIGDNDNDDTTTNEIDYNFLSYELEYLSVYGYRPTTTTTVINNTNEANVGVKRRNKFHTNNQKENEKEQGNNKQSMSSPFEGYDYHDELLFEHVHHLNLHRQQQQLKRRQGRRTTNYNDDRNSYTSSLLHVPIHELHEHDDIINKLGIPGGKSELVNILLNGAYAREVLMRQNVKLVMSIAKSWMRNSASSSNSGGAGPSTLTQLYEGSWDKPSLDEVVQEGIIGLARAVDKYDPNVGVRFSTYATYWITSYVRNCFQRALTGCLRVPSQLHDIKAAYNQIVRDHNMNTNGDGDGGNNNVPLEQKRIARQLGISERRLHIAIRATKPLLSVDAPVMNGGGGSYKGSMAGGDVRNNQELLLLDTLKCAEPKPEDQVELSFLRQCLENAMATELTPYERDILRLRLGLDSGECRTVREIVELSGGIVSMADVRAAERRAFRKLRSPASVHTHNLLAYLDFTGSTIEDSMQ
jgi:RNA polymerase sigma factor (sigma-70 family)